MATHTWTMDVTTLVYVDSSGISHTVTDGAQTFKTTFTDTGNGGFHVGLEDAARIKFSDGYSVDVECDPAFTYMSFASDGALVGGNQPRLGTMTFVEPSGHRNICNITAANFTDADGTGANNAVLLSFESRANTMQKFDWTNMNTA